MAMMIFAITQYQQRDMSSGQAPTSIEIDYSRGPTLVYFWGSWCSICLTTSPSVNSLNQEENHYKVITVALSSGTNENIDHYLSKHSYTFEAINDDNGRISKNWGVAVTPSIFIIDKKGLIRFTSTGITSLWGMKLRLWLASF